MSNVENEPESSGVVAEVICDPPCLEGRTIDESFVDTVLDWYRTVQLDNYVDVDGASYVFYVYTYLMKTYGPGHFTLRVSKTSPYPASFHQTPSNC